MKHFSGFNKFFPGLILVFFLFALFIVTAFSVGHRKSYKNYVVLVSLDGFRWDYADLYKTPNINKIAAEGV